MTQPNDMWDVMGCSYAGSQKIDVFGAPFIPS
jgi:hypothetical protein